MDNDESNWFEEILQSMKGDQKAKPDARLFLKIQEEIIKTNTIIDLQKLRKYALAVILIILINTSVFIFLNQNSKNNTDTNEIQISYQNSLVTSFQIYDL